MLQHLIETYGYAAVFVGCFLEGETVLMLAGFAAHRGYLSLPVVLATAAVAGFAGDQTAYLLGRTHGEALLARFPRLADAKPFVSDKLARYGVVLVFLIRFLVGFRVATPLVIGASRAMPPWRFALPNAAGAAFWACVVGGAGYAFGTAFETFVEHARHYEEWAFAALALAAIAALGVRRIVARRRLRPPPRR
jgi:membrane protein DedA with SNARE-associated domain